MMKFEGTGADVSKILLSLMDGDGTVELEDPGEELAAPALVVVESMKIAMVEHIDGAKFKIKALSCYAPVHGAHPRHSQITKTLAPYNDKQNQNITCPICASTGWIKPGGAEAQTAVSFAVTLGFFRGVQLPKSEELSKAQEGAVEAAFSHVLDHPLVTRIQKEYRTPGDVSDETE